MADRLAEQERIRRDFLLNASHEFRTPLSNVRVALETLLETPRGRVEMQQRMLQGAVGEVERLTLLVSDLLDLARIESDARAGSVGLPVERRDISCRALIQPLTAAVAPRLRVKQLHLEVAVPPDLWITADEQRLRQAVMNLLDNAIRCSPEGGRLRIAARVRDEEMEISVTDDGPGIPEADLPYIFDRFYTVNKARSRAASGTGLGLAITRSILEAHGGSVHVENRAQGGSTFALLLPARRPSAIPRWCKAGRRAFVPGAPLALRCPRHGVVLSTINPIACSLLSRLASAVPSLREPVITGLAIGAAP